jgi:hypothetical protein
LFFTHPSLLIDRVKRMSFSFYFLGVSSIHYPLPEIPQIERINNRPATSRSEGNWKKSGE